VHQFRSKLQCLRQCTEWICSQPARSAIVRASFTLRVRWSARADKLSCVMHRTMSPPASNSDTSTSSVHRLHPFDHAQDRPATDKIAGSPRRACPHYKQCQTIHYRRNACFVYNAQPGHVHGSFRTIHPLDHHSTFHNQPLELRYECQFYRAEGLKSVFDIL